MAVGAAQLRPLAASVELVAAARREGAAGRQGEQRRRYYRTTPQGAKFLKSERETWESFTSAVNEIIGARHA